MAAAAPAKRPQSLGTTAVRGAISTVFWQSNRAVLQLVAVVVLSRLLAPHDVGLLAMVLAITGFAELLRDFGLFTAAVQAKSLSPAQKSNLFWVNTGIGASLTLIVFALSWPIALLYGEPDLVVITQWIAPTFLLNGIATQFRAELNRRMRFNALSLSELVPQVAGLVVAVLVALQVPRYPALIAQQLTVSMVGLLFVVLAAKWRPGLPSRKSGVRSLLRFGAGLVGTQSLAYVTKNIDNVSIGYVWGAATLGIYGRSYQLIMMPLGQFTAPLSRVAIPVLVKLVDDTKAFSSYLLAGQSATGLCSCTAYGLIIGLAEPFITVALGDRWQGMVPIVQALAVGGIFRALGQVSFWIFIAKGLTGHQFRFYLMTQPMISLLMVAGLPWGGIGVAIGHSIAYVLFWFTQLWWVGRVASMDTRPLMWNGLTIFGAVAVPSIAISFAATLLIASPWLQLAVGTAVVVLVQGLILLLPGPRRQVTRLRALLRGRKIQAAP
ncbi:MAG TPA: lipopolysaccharide biosynthesis protein [Geminicoccus sp.]|uniref:lipopolysaccharide biosynthesis protein n=1 Tax=Geminicoccus sp. TaxID=2024832 RepID=UPI002E324D0F|nr:lipopolysaccharide biosynthesis protein [Geminicoccus sp.]HEX2528069.1 lipopolysaccharide biosynthesis protein [Geminicoccus sp.]